MRQVVHHDTGQDHQGSHPVDRSDSGTGLLVRRDRRKEGSRQVETGRGEGSLAAVVGAVDLAERPLDGPETVVPIAPSVSARVVCNS